MASAYAYFALAKMSLHDSVFPLLEKMLMGVGTSTEDALLLGVLVRKAIRMEKFSKWHNDVYLY